MRLFSPAPLRRLGFTVVMSVALFLPCFYNAVLRGVDLDKTDDFWDRLKFIPLSPDQNVWLTIGGQARERGEYFRLVDYLLVIDAERTLLANQLSLAQAVNFQMSASIHLIKALGGGWNPPEERSGH